MATRQQLDATYGYMDEIFRLTFGPAPDITAALFDGDLTKTIERAQRDKHEYILRNLGFAPGARILDVGCGWGPLLKAVREGGGRGVGLCLSTRQAAACRQQGFDVYLADWKRLRPESLGRFDGVVSVGALEHFCSDEEYFAGRQEAIYRAFFHFCSVLLPPGRRLYVQTMIWGKNAPRFEAVSLDAPRGSTEYIVALVRTFYPGSFLPFGVSQLARCAEPDFRVVSTKNGRLDYIETMNRWNAVFRPTPAKVAAAVRLLPYLMRDRDFFRRLELLLGSWNQECFKREIFDHERIVFERV